MRTTKQNEHSHPQQSTCQQPFTSEQQAEYDSIASAVMVITLGARSRDGKHDASTIIGFALSEKYGATHTMEGLNLAQKWDEKTGGFAVSVFNNANPDHPDPVTVNSIFDIARANGWTQQTETEPWPELQELCAHTDPSDYPIDALPLLIRSAVEEVCAFVKAPVAMVGMSALAALSVAIQAHTDVQRDPILQGPCGLFLLCIADSGERKTSADGYFSKTIREYEKREREKAKPLIKAYETETEAWKSRKSGMLEKIKALEKDSRPTQEQEDLLHELDHCKPIPPRVPRLMFSDATPEALALNLVNGWPSGGVFSNEAGMVLGGHAMNKDTAMRNMSRLNQLWDGTIATTDRVLAASYDETVARLTISLQVQEPTLRAFFANTKELARGTGFLARFLVAWPTSTIGTRTYEPPSDVWPALAAFNNRLSAILDSPAPVDENGILTPAKLALSPEAKTAWAYFHNQIEAKLGPGGELIDLRDVGSKAADNVARLAALFHMFNKGNGEIDFDCIESATRIVTWHLLESKRFLGELAMPAELANPMRLEAWLIDYCRRENTDKVPTKKAQQFGPSGLREKAMIDGAVKELSELGRARMIKYGKKKLIQVRSELLERTA